MICLKETFHKKYIRIKFTNIHITYKVIFYLVFRCYGGRFSLFWQQVISRDKLMFGPNQVQPEPMRNCHMIAGCWPSQLQPWNALMCPHQANDVTSIPIPLLLLCGCGVGNSTSEADCASILLSCESSEYNMYLSSCLIIISCKDLLQQTPSSLPQSRKRFKGYVHYWNILHVPHVFKVEHVTCSSTCIFSLQSPSPCDSGWRIFSLHLLL